MLKRLLPLIFLCTIATPAQFYTTTFPATENPIAQGTPPIWLNGGVNCTDWGNVKTLSGTGGIQQATGTIVNGAPPFNDSEAILTGVWGTTQTALGVVHTVNQPINAKQEEVEIRLRSTCSAHVDNGYEFDASLQGASGSLYFVIVRHNGPLNNFCYLNNSGGCDATFNAATQAVTNVHIANGDNISATATGTNPTTLTFFHNGTQVMQRTDSGLGGVGCTGSCITGPFTGGSPGMGFWNLNGTTADFNDYGFSTFTAQGGILAADCNTTSVQTAVNAVSDGDTVLIPDGSCTWTTGISTTKQIQILAQHIDTTTPLVYGTIPSRAVTLTNAETTMPMFTMVTGNTFHSRIAGIYFKETATPAWNHVRFTSTGTKEPFLDNTTMEVAQRFGNASDVAVWAILSTGTVSWNDYVVGVATAGTSGECCPNGASIHLSSPIPWYSNDTLGTADTIGNQNVYFEDSVWDNFGQGFDCDDNCRIASRHMTWAGIQAQTHGLSSSFGGRQVEVYNSTIGNPHTNRNANRYLWDREGRWLVHDNTVAYQNQGFGTPILFDSIVECAPGVSCANDGSVPYPRLVGTSGSGGGEQTSWTCSTCTGTKATSTPANNPSYIWNNCIAGHTLPCTGDSHIASGGGVSPFFFQQNRDYFLDSGALAGYTPFPYPHPDRALAFGGGSAITPPPAPAMTPTNFNYGTVTQGTTSAAATFQVSNNSGSTITFVSRTLSGANAADFSISTSNCTGTLASGGTPCTVSVVATPSSIPGTIETAQLNVSYTGFSGSPLTSTLTVTSGSPGVVSIAPTTETFSSIIGVQTAAQTATVTNHSGASITFTGASYSGSFPTQYVTTANSCGGTLPNNSTCTISTAYTPSVISPPTQTAMLSLTFTGASGSPLTVSLSGTGLPSSINPPAPAQTMMSKNLAGCPAAKITTFCFTADGKIYVATCGTSCAAYVPYGVTALSVNGQLPQVGNVALTIPTKAATTLQ